MHLIFCRPAPAILTLAVFVMVVTIVTVPPNSPVSSAYSDGVVSTKASAAAEPIGTNAQAVPAPVVATPKRDAAPGAAFHTTTSSIQTRSAIAESGRLGTETDTGPPFGLVSDLDDVDAVRGAAPYPAPPLALHAEAVQIITKMVPSQARLLDRIIFGGVKPG